MSDKRVLRNFVNGESVDTIDGRTTDLVDPSTGAVFGTAPLSSDKDVDRAYAAAAEAFETWRDTTPSERQKAHAGHRGRAREPRGRAGRDREPEHGQADRADAVGGDPADGGPDPVLRRRGAAARGPLHRGVHGRPHLDDPPRAGGRDRPGRAVELPDDDGGLEVRARDRRGQHGGAQAVGHHAGEHGADGRADLRVRRAAARRAQRHLRRPGHRPRPRGAQDPRDGVHHRVGAGGHGGGRRGRQGPQARAPRAGRQGPGDRVRRRRPGGGGRERRDRRLLQRRAGLHGCDPRPGRPRASTATWSPRSPSRRRASCRRTTRVPATRTPCCRR